MMKFTHAALKIMLIYRVKWTCMQTTLLQNMKMYLLL